MRHIPNLLTLCNLLAGFTGIVFVPYNLLFASAMIYVAMLFDFLDGFVARLFRTSSSIGKELDSLADIISFGVLPALILFHFLVPDLYWSSVQVIPFYVVFLLMIPVCAALRLARFNVDQSQQFEYKGLPVPANASWIASVPIIVRHYPEHSLLHGVFSSPYLLILMVAVFSMLMVSKIPLMALKFRNYKFLPNIVRYVFIILAISLLLIMQVAAVPYLFLLYLIGSVLEYAFIRKRFE